MLFLVLRDSGSNVQEAISGGETYFTVADPPDTLDGPGCHIRGGKSLGTAVVVHNTTTGEEKATISIDNIPGRTGTVDVVVAAQTSAADVTGTTVEVARGANLNLSSLPTGTAAFAPRYVATVIQGQDGGTACFHIS